jgi:pyruvate/2-oxoglutarate dehydrogenase complex dihydrolipoamide dehydrogenase (E3) component
MESENYDFIVIGAGSAGYAAARTALSPTRRIAIVDSADELGGLCILRGCMPSKALIFAADVLHLARHGADFGLEIPVARAAMQAIARRTARIIGEFADHRRTALESEEFVLYRSSARFTGTHEIELADGRRLRGKKFLIATGSQVRFPPIPGLEEAGVWTSDDVLALDFVPDSVIVLGAGNVGCELAQFLTRIGSRVTLIQRSERILTGMREETARVVEQAFMDEGIELFTATAVQEVRRQGDGFEAVFECHGEPVVRRASFCLNALGRSPNTARLGLAEAGVAISGDGRIVADSNQRTSNPDIYAAGDCCGPHDIVHLAVRQGETAANHAFGKPGDPLPDRPLLQVIFTDPQVAVAGIADSELVAAGRKFITASYSFSDLGKSILMEARRGFVRIAADVETGELLGAEIVGRDAGELIHCLAVAITLKATVFDLLRVPWYHPTLAEIISYPAEEIAEEILGRRTARPE